MLEFLKGGVLRGQRTYILGALVALQAVAAFLVGDITMMEFMEQLPEILAGLGIMTLRAAITQKPSEDDEPPTGI